MFYSIDEETALVVGENPQMGQVISFLKEIAPTNCTVLITGESGVGKEVAARFIHSLSPRRHNRFADINCAAFSANLIESEFFGHEKGAFTTAEATRIGYFESADKGTVLLDEISELDLRLQAKLLRFLEKKIFERVGSCVTRKVDVRIIATTNQNLATMVKNKLFRQDLYYRLNVIPVYIPPLRKRTEDIIPLTHYFLTKHCHEEQIPLKTLDKEAGAVLLTYPWPGNVRELFNVLKRVVVRCKNPVIKPEDISSCLISSEEPVSPESNLVGRSMEEIEQMAILKTLKHFAGNMRRTAEALHITDRTLRNKVKTYNLRQRHPPQMNLF